MEQFPHLRLVQKITGKPRFFGGGSESKITKANKEDRHNHYRSLRSQIESVGKDWTSSLARREKQNLAQLNAEIVPIFLKINPSLLGLVNFDLSDLGIEIISEEENGYIVGASIDGMRSLREKIEGFLAAKYGTGIVANLWQILDGDHTEWKKEYILSEELLEKWNTIQDQEIYKLEVGIAFDKPLGQEPDPEKQGGEKRLKEHRKLEIKRDELFLERENHFDAFIKYYGSRTSSIVSYEDSFACEVAITGIGLKDLAENYPFVFEISEKEEIENIGSDEQDSLDIDMEVMPPDDDSPEVGVIDSGVMENHRYLEDAINPLHSKSYLPGDPSTADHVRGGGHGTKVAGAVLYPKGVSALQTPYRLPCFIRNLRILDSENYLTTNFPAALMKTIVSENKECGIFNLSVASRSSCQRKHMSSWAASIDTLINEHNVLFIISTGNIDKSDIRRFIRDGDNYPSYLSRSFCQIANPSQSSFAISVGSINYAQFQNADWESLGSAGDVSPFSRIGPGIWDKIKPDVVEYGGGLVIARNPTFVVTGHPDISPELIRSTLYGGRAYDKSTVGTSYAAPKVSHIAAQLKKLYPKEGINLIRALIIQGSRLPNQFFRAPTLESFQRFGYGLPSLERVTGNSEHRISFYGTNRIRAEEGHVYSLKIPAAIRNPGDDYEILIEITLAFTAKVRRTRQKTKSYLGTWLEWSTSKIDESYQDFKNYTLSEIGDDATEYDRDVRKRMDSFQWKLSDRSDRGEVNDLNRTNSTVQKDWTIIKSNRLNEEINIAVRAHRGWDKKMEEVPYALIVSIEVLGANVPIYELVRVENQVEIRV
jgi:hypothetical protein